MEEMIDLRYLSKYDLPVGLAFGTTAIVDNRLFYIGGTTGTLSPGKKFKFQKCST